jgi:cysteine synthase B
VIIKDITQLIGNTPLLEIDPSVHGLKNINLFAKLELLNPFGSVKDKTAWNMLRHDLDNIKAKSQTVIESSSGNTAKALQMILSMHKVPFKIVTNRIQVREVKQILQLIGTEIEELPGQSQCLDPTDPNDPQFIVEQIINSEPEKYFHTSQYTNMRNLEAHTVMTGEEIAKDLERVDYFFGGLGTTGSTRGTGIRLKTTNPQLKNIGIIASKGEGLPGIRNADEMYEVGLFDNKFYDTIIEVTVDESIDAMLTLIRSCGILSGPTGGASFAAVLKYFKKIDEQLDGKNGTYHTYKNTGLVSLG